MNPAALDDMLPSVSSAHTSWHCWNLSLSYAYGSPRLATTARICCCVNQQSGLTEHHAHLLGAQARTARVRGVDVMRFKAVQDRNAFL